LLLRFFASIREAIRKKREEAKKKAKRKSLIFDIKDSSSIYKNLKTNLIYLL
jgi:hypothetical protein